MVHTGLTTKIFTDHCQTPFSQIVATIFVLFAVQLGPVAVAAVVIGLYPGVTAGLARIFLGERLARHQVVGIVLALAGIALLSV